jgi:hypothetical protein
MIISHQHKFIFLKTNKTAGTSVEIALSKICGPDDIITPIVPEDEQIRQELGYRGPQHCYAPLSEYTFWDRVKLFVKGKKKLKYYHHISAREVKALIAEEVWNSYYKFCFERNPFDRIISSYYWYYKKKKKLPSISTFLATSPYIKLLKDRGYRLYTIDGKVVVDKIYRFENLKNDFELACQQIGITEPLSLPHTKGKFRKEKKSYREILTEADKAAIEKLFADEIKLMGYGY